MSDQHINKKVSEALESLDGMQRATPAPYFMTRLNARLQQQVPGSFWQRAAVFIGRPVFAIAGLLLFVLINVIVLSSPNRTNGSESTASNPRLEFAVTIASNYEIENQEP